MNEYNLQDSIWCTKLHINRQFMTMLYNQPASERRDYYLQFANKLIQELDALSLALHTRDVLRNSFEHTQL